MFEQNLENIKDQYQNTELPGYLIYNGWADLKFKLPEQQNKFWKIYLGRGLIFATICILITTAIVGKAQAAKPGDILFPVKTFTEDIKATITGNYQEKIENRAQDVIDLSTKSQDKLDKAIENYQQTVKESLEKTKGNQNQDELNKAIEEHNQQIKKIEDRDSNQSNHSQNNNGSGQVNGQRSTDHENRDSSGRSEQNRQTNQNLQIESKHQSENKSD